MVEKKRKRKRKKKRKKKKERKERKNNGLVSSNAIHIRQSFYP